MANNKGINSSAPTTGEVVAGVYNAVPPTLQDGQAAALQLDVNGKLITSSSGGGGSSNVNITGINGVAPALTNPLPVELSDGTNPLGTDANPIRNSPSSTAAVQPVSAASLPLPTGAATEATLATRLAEATFTGRINTQGQKTMAASTPIVVASDQSSIPVAATLTAETTKVIGTVNQGTSPWVVAGNKTNNNAAPGATNIGTLPAIANAAAPTWVEGDQVGLSSDLAGNLRSAVSLNSFVSMQNSTTTPLGSNGVFTGTSESILGFSAVSVEIFANQASAANGFSFQQSQDGTNWDLVQTVTVSASTLLTVVYPVIGQFFRIIYTNSASAQATFRLQAIKQVIPGKVTVQGATIPGGTTTTTDPNPVIVGGKTPAGTVALVECLTNLGSGMGAIQIAVPTNTYSGDSTNIISLCGPTSTNAAVLAVAQMAVVNATQSGTVLVRTPNVFKTATVVATAAGNTAVWTPAAGKKFRLMRFQITGVNLVATAATVITISFQDNVTGITIGTYDVLLPAAATATDILAGGVQFISEWVDLGNGFLSAAANNVLNANVSATVAGATGSFRYNVCGTEE